MASNRQTLGPSSKTLFGALGIHSPVSAEVAERAGYELGLLAATLHSPGSEAHGRRQGRGAEKVRAVSKDISSTQAPGVP